MLIQWIIVAIVFVAILSYVGFRLARSNVDPITVANAEQRLGPRAALQFALDEGLPLRTSEGETDGFNVWNARNVSGLRVPGDLSGGSR